MSRTLLGTRILAGDQIKMRSEVLGVGPHPLWLIPSEKVGLLNKESSVQKGSVVKT